MVDVECDGCGRDIEGRPRDWIAKNGELMALCTACLKEGWRDIWAVVEAAAAYERRPGPAPHKRLRVALAVMNREEGETRAEAAARTEKQGGQ